MPDKRMHDLRINGERACEASARGLSQCQRRAHDRWRPRVHGLTDGTFAAFDDNTLDQVWKINVGTGFNAPPITFETDGKQYVAILSGISNITKNRHVLTP